MMSMVSTMEALGALVTSSLGVTGLLQLPMLLLPGQDIMVIVATTGITGLFLCRALVDWVEVATLVTAGEGG